MHGEFAWSECGKKNVKPADGSKFAIAMAVTLNYVFRCCTVYCVMCGGGGRNGNSDSNGGDDNYSPKCAQHFNRSNYIWQ